MLLPSSGGVIDPNATMDREEADECRKMHKIIEQYDMKSTFRWIVAQKNRVRNGELYRYVADLRGAFAQPALYEGEAWCARGRGNRVGGCGWRREEGVYGGGGGAA
jgi:hypothetical protein